MINVANYKPVGDKKNSDYFEGYREKIYERRQTCGLTDLIEDMAAVVVQVQTGDALSYIKELYLMTPYRYQASFINSTHKIYCLVNTIDAPIFFLLEPLDNGFNDDITRINKLYPNACEKFNARYVGEVFKTKNKKETQSILTSHDIHFVDVKPDENLFYSNPHFSFTCMSDFTYNRVGYVDVNLFDFEALELGQSFSLTKHQQAELDGIHAWGISKGVAPLIKGIDHLATRILAGEREDAILEFLCLSNYYFWGAYNIKDMNSSTNVNRVLHGNDIRSPAKVFTANNIPYMVNSFDRLPMPTESFVRNYGRRLHHIAYEIIDGDSSMGEKNIDHVVNTLRDEANVHFLANIFGDCKDVPDLKQIFSKHSAYSILITEYVERCHQFDGFFTKQNVAALTNAAGLDEEIKPAHHGVVGD